jgi:hypothetical protein
MYIVLIEIGILLAALPGGDGGDGAGVVGDGAGERTRSNDMAKMPGWRVGMYPPPPTEWQFPHSQN